MTAPRVPVVFVHGLWLHTASWAPWVAHFRDAGFDPVAPGWPGEPDTVAAAREDPQALAGVGIAEAAAHYGAIIDALPDKPVLVGHSFGGLLAQKLLGQGRAAAAVAIDAAPIRGVVALPPAQLRSVLPVLRTPANRRRTVSLTPEQFRYAFGNAISAVESAELHERWAIPAPGRPVFQAAVANLVRRSPAAVDTANPERGPLLLIGGGRDHAVPAAVSRATHRRYRRSPAVTEYREFPDRGHSLTIDSGWREVADYAITWLSKHPLTTG